MQLYHDTKIVVASKLLSIATFVADCTITKGKLNIMTSVQIEGGVSCRL